MVYSALIGAWLSPILLIYTGVSIATAPSRNRARSARWRSSEPSPEELGRHSGSSSDGLHRRLLGDIERCSGEPPRSLRAQFGITVIGVIVFTGMAAWKAQQMSWQAAPAGGASTCACAVVGALQLYITFINLFLIACGSSGTRELTASPHRDGAVILSKASRQPKGRPAVGAARREGALRSDSDRPNGVRHVDSSSRPPG
jgi:hypothetical protein